MAASIPPQRSFVSREWAILFRTVRKASGVVTLLFGILGGGPTARAQDAQCTGTCTMTIQVT